MFKRWRRISGGAGDFVITGGGAGDSVTTGGEAGCDIPFAVLIVIYDELRRYMVRRFPMDGLKGKPIIDVPRIILFSYKKLKKQM